VVQDFFHQQYPDVFSSKKTWFSNESFMPCLPLLPQLAGSRDGGFPGFQAQSAKAVSKWQRKVTNEGKVESTKKLL